MSDGEDTKSASIKLHGSTYERLRELQKEDETLREALNRILPEELGEIVQFDENTVALPTSSKVAGMVQDAAGENVTANDVVDRLIDQYEENND